MGKELAVIGMAVELPGINDLETFWEMISSGEVINKPFPTERQQDLLPYIRYVQETMISNMVDKSITFHDGSFFSSIKHFDYSFFGMTPKQANVTDPHQRMVLRTIYLALENAGYLGRRIKGTKTGVFIGYASNPGQSYAEYLAKVDPSLSQIALTGNLPTMLANRISYFLDLHGSSTVVDSACSASLVAVHNAKNALLVGDCDMAVIAGVRIAFAPLNNTYNKIGIESSDGRTRTFDNDADGTGLGEGSGAIVLKQLDKAIAEHDQIYAVIKGSAVNHDGNKEVITNPDAQSQARLLISAWENAEVAPTSIGYIEAHGTATRIGDPIEIEGLKLAFDKFTNKKNFCAVGTVKANIGHLFEGSGVMSIIKAVLSLKNKQIAPLANFSKPNQRIDFDNSPVYISTVLKPWDVEDNLPRRCGVSAFGLGGNNCHVVLEEYLEPAIKEDSILNEPYVFTISAASKRSFFALIDKYIEFFSACNSARVSLENICYTSNISRSHYKYKIAIITSSRDDLLSTLKSCQNSSVSSCKSLVFSNIDLESDNYQTGSFISRDIPSQLITDLGDRINNLITFCELYIRDEEVDWVKLYDLNTVFTVLIPSYVFEKNDCWVDFPENTFQEYKNNNKVVNPTNPPTHKIVFKPTLFTEKAADSYNVLVITNREATNCIKLDFGNWDTEVVFLEKADGTAIFNLDSSEQEVEYQKIAQKLSENGYTHIVHAMALEKEPASCLAEIELRTKKNLYSLFHITKQLILLGVKTNLITLTYNSLYINSDDHELVAENSILTGFCKTISREYPFIMTKLIDFDYASQNANLFKVILSNDYGIFGIRNNLKYVETFEEYDEWTDNNYLKKENYIKPTGNYVITGGAGAIGLEVCRLFSEQASNINLFLIIRSKIPERSAWNELLQKSSNPQTISKISVFKELEKQGVSLHFFDADVSDIEKMSAIFTNINKQFGRIDGIVHAAGVPGKNLIQFRSLLDFEAVIKPKLYGTFILDYLTKHNRPDFIVYFSSVATVFPSPGQADYAAGNYYQDTVASLNSDENCHVVAFDWVAWKEIGMAVEYETNQDTTFKALPTKTGIEILDKGLRSAFKRIFAGEIHYDSQLVQILKSYDIKFSDIISEKIHTAMVNLEAQTSKASEEIRKKIDNVEVLILGESSEGYTPFEIIVAKCWASAFGYTEIDIHEDFYNLGGDSIAAISIATNLSTYFNIKLETFSLLSCKTIHNTAALIASMTDKIKNGNEKENDIAV